MLLRCALGMNEQHTVFSSSDGTVFYASKVRKDALFMEHKYAWDDVKLISLRMKYQMLANIKV